MLKQFNIVGNVPEKSNDKKFFDLFNRLRKSDNGSGDRLNSFFFNISRKYRVDKEEVAYLGLMTILKISRKNKTIDDKKLESYIWRSIRNTVFNYIKSEKRPRNAMINEAIELDDYHWVETNEFRDFEIKHTVNQLFNVLEGRDWRIVNLIYRFGNNVEFICESMGITKNDYFKSLLNIRSAVLGYA